MRQPTATQNRVAFSVMLDPEHYEALERLAEQNGRSKGEELRRMLSAAIEPGKL